MRLDGLDHVAITVRDPLTSMAWYRDALGLERRLEEARGDYPIVMIAGESGVAPFPASSAEPGAVEINTYGGAPDFKLRTACRLTRPPGGATLHSKVYAGARWPAGRPG